MSNKATNYIQVYFSTENKSIVDQLIVAIADKTGQKKNKVMAESLMFGLHEQLNKLVANRKSDAEIAEFARNRRSKR